MRDPLAHLPKRCKVWREASIPSPYTFLRNAPVGHLPQVSYEARCARSHSICASRHLVRRTNPWAHTPWLKHFWHTNGCAPPFLETAAGLALWGRFLWRLWPPVWGWARFSALRELTCGGCLSGALQARSEFRRTGPRQVDAAESAPWRRPPQHEPPQGQACRSPRKPNSRQLSSPETPASASPQTRGTPARSLPSTCKSPGPGPRPQWPARSSWPIPGAAWSW